MAANVLIVEDEPIIGLDIKQRLVRLGYGVVAIADCLEQALEMARLYQPDMVLMDICINGEADGIQAAQLLRCQFDLPVVFLTAHADCSTLQRAIGAEPFGYIVKPFDNADLVTAIEICLSRCRAEQAIQGALARERELNQLKSHFVSVVSHEFRNPLSIILASIDLLEEGDRDLPPEKKRKYWQQARTSVSLMKRLLEDILILGEGSTNRIKNQPSPVNVSLLCKELLDELSIAQPAKHTFHFSEVSNYKKIPTLVYLDPKLLGYILNNLLSNAIKYSPNGGSISLRLLHDKNILSLDVQDQGIGISSVDRERLFDTFYRGNNVGTIQGTGLGLSIVKQCVEAQAGSIEFESLLGVGTTFTVTLPYKVATHSSKALKTSSL